MRTSWTKLSGLILFAAAVAYGCGSDSKTTPPVAEGGLCGNGTIDTGEDCDGTKLNSKTCQTQGMGTFTGGALTCSATTCKFVTTACTKAATGTGGTTGTGGAPVGNGGSPSGGKKGLDGGTDGGKATGGTTGAGGTTSTDAGSKTDASDAKAPS